MSRRRKLKVCPHGASCFECGANDCLVKTSLAPLTNALEVDLLYDSLYRKQEHHTADGRESEGTFWHEYV